MNTFCSDGETVKFIFSKQLSMANVAIVSETHICVSKSEASEMALISLWFRESPEIPSSPLMSRTEADYVSFAQRKQAA